jgi:hypothetical protein
MATVERIADRGLGYLGLFLIGAMSWVADHLCSAHGPVPRVPSPMVALQSNTRDRAGRPGVRLAATHHTGG